MANKKHYALFVPTMGGGGAERVVMLLANGLAERGHRVDLILIKAAGPYLESVSNSVRVVELRSKRVSYSILPLIRYFRREHPDAMISALRTCNIVAVIARHLSQVTTILLVSEHSNFRLTLNSGPKWRAFLINKLMGWAYRRSDRVIAVSQRVAHELEEGLCLEKRSVRTIYNPVLTDKMLEHSRAGIDRVAKVGEVCPVIVSAGRLVKEKDFPTLIRAFSIVKKSREARLLILGEGEMRASLESMIAELGLTDCVELPGFVGDPMSYMKLSSVFVISSELEAFGNVLVEAMACGVPVVATDASGPVEILEHGKWGRLVPIGDVEKLATAIIASIDKIDIVDATERALVFNVDNAIDQYLSAIHL